MSPLLILTKSYLIELNPICEAELGASVFLPFNTTLPETVPAGIVIFLTAVMAVGMPGSLSLSLPNS